MRPEADPTAEPMPELAMTLPAEPQTLRVVRRAFRRLAVALRLDPGTWASFEVALGEAVNNAVEHAYGATKGHVDVRVRREGTALVAEVEDHGRWRPERDERRGHGLRIMQTLVDSAEVTRTGAGTVVRLVISLPDPSPERRQLRCP